MSFEEKDTIIIFATSALAVILIVFFLFIIINNYKKNAKKHQDEIRLIYKTEENERARFAKDLHDGIGALLSAAKLHAGLLEENDSKEEIAEIAENIIGVIDQAVNDLRTMVSNLIPKNIIENGWIVELQETVRIINLGKKLHINLVVNEDKIRFNPETEINLYRIVQELINNTMKHSEALKITVNIEKKDGYLVIDAADNGIGFETEKVTNGHGFKNIQTRLSAHKGTMEISKNKEKGARFIIRFLMSNLT